VTVQTATVQTVTVQTVNTRNMNIRTTALLPLACLLAGLLLLSACGGGKPAGTSTKGAGSQATDGLKIPNPDSRNMEPQVRRRLAEARRAVEAKTTSASAWGRFAMVADVHELDQVALVCYRKAQQLAPSDIRWPYLQARLLAAQGADLATAVQLFGQALKLDPDYVPGYLRLADALAQKGDLQAAEGAYRQALELDPDLARAHLGLGQILLRLGDAAKAATALERANALEPTDATALSALSQTFRRLGRREEATEAARQAALREPVETFEDPLLQEVSAEGVSSTLLIERALEYLRLERYREALGDLLLAEKSRPDDPYLQQGLGRAYRGVGDPNTAASHFEKSLVQKPDLLQARVLLGLALVEAQRIAEARPHLERARREAPDNLNVATNIALALLQAGQVGGALSEFERAASLGELPGPAHNAWGSILAQRGRLNEALGHFEKAFLSDPENPQVLFNLGLASEAMGRREKAMEYYRRTMVIEPNPMAQERLAQLTGG